MSDKALAPDKLTAETLKDSLVDLQQMEAWQVVRSRLADLEDQCRRRLEVELQPHLLYQCQGELKGYKSARNVVKEMLRELQLIIDKEKEQ